MRKAKSVHCGTVRRSEVHVRTCLKAAKKLVRTNCNIEDKNRPMPEGQRINKRPGSESTQSGVVNTDTICRQTAAGWRTVAIFSLQVNHKKLHSTGLLSSHLVRRRTNNAVGLEQPSLPKRYSAHREGRLVREQSPPHATVGSDERSTWSEGVDLFHDNGACDDDICAFRF